MADTKPQHQYEIGQCPGTGKTWVMHALLIWQYLNASDNLNKNNFSKNFLIVAPGLIVYISNIININHDSRIFKN